MALTALKSKLGAIVKASDKQLKGKSHKTIVAIFQMLRTLCVVLEGGLDAHMPNLIESTHRCLQDKNQARWDGNMGRRLEGVWVGDEHGRKREWDGMR